MTATSAASRRLDTLLRDDRRTWFATLAAAFFVFAMTAHWQVGQVNDAQAAIWPAWQLINAGTLDLSAAVGLPDLPWFGEVDGKVVSYRTMGVILSGVPFAALVWPLGWTPEQVGALAACTYTAFAVANMHLVFRSLVSPRLAALAAGTLALGTPLWTTAAAELWTHGPDAFWLSCALLALTRQRLVLAGAAFAPAIMVRPHLAAACAALGLTLAWLRRSPLSAVKVGLPAAAALPVLYVWNGWYYGTANVGGAYQGHVTSAVAAPAGDNTQQFLRDAAGAFFSPDAGLLLYSPLVALLLVLVPLGWRTAPAWARGALLGAIAYQVVQLRVNRYTGGGGFYSNRLVVEFVVLSSPVWLLGVRAWTLSLRRATVVAGLAGLGIAIHAFGAFNAYYWRGTPGDWWIYYPWVVLQAIGLRGWGIAACLALVPVLAVLLVRKHYAAGPRASSPLAAPIPSSAVPAQRPGAGASTRR